MLRWNADGRGTVETNASEDHCRRIEGESMYDLRAPVAIVANGGADSKLQHY